MSDWDDGWKLKIPASGLTDVVNDTTPQLGGALDPNTFGVSAMWGPNTDDGAPLGSTAKQWSDLFLASGAVINFNNSNAYIEHSASQIAFINGLKWFQRGAAATSEPLRSTNTNDSASVMVARLDGDRATMGAGDEAYVSLRLSDSAGNQDEFVRLAWKATDVTSTSEDGEFAVSVISAGALTEAFRIGVNYVELSEQTAPAAPAANKVRIYCVDNGAGKTRLMALFPTGAAQQIAIEP
jgi:hypothetical protein